MSITTPWRRRRTRRRSRARAASGRRRRARPTEARNLQRAEGRLRVACLQALRRALDIVGPLDRTGSLPRAALIEVSLQELAHQLLAPPVQLPFEVALTHLLGFGRTEEDLGLSEGGLGCCTPPLVGASGAVGHGSHRSTRPQPLLRIPDHRMVDPDRLERLTGTAAAPVHAISTAGGARRRPGRHLPRTSSALRSSQRHLLSHGTVPKRRANVQGARRRGRTEAPRRRDQAGLAALAARKQAGANAVPPYGAPKRERPPSANAHEQGGKCSTKKSRTPRL